MWPWVLLKAVPFLKAWWKVIVPIVLLLLALGYVKILHLKIDHYREQVVELRLANKEAEQQVKKLEDNATVLTKKYERSLENKQLEIDRVVKQRALERIKHDEETKRIRLSANVVGLFNSGKPPSDGEDPAPAVRSNDENPPAGGKTLNDLLTVVVINDANHEACRQQVIEWQNFWTDYENSFKATVREPS